MVLLMRCRDGWVDYLEIAKRPDFHHASTHYFWFLDKVKIQETALSNVFKAMLNTRIR